MKTVIGLLVAVFLGIGVAGCGQQPQAGNSSEAINYAKTLETVDAQAQYLVKQANGFLKSEQYQEAVKSAQYVLSNLDAEAYVEQARKIVEKAKAEIEAQAKAAMGDAKSKLGL